MPGTGGTTPASFGYLFPSLITSPPLPYRLPKKANLTCVLSQAGGCFLCIIYTYFRVPEPTGRTFAELDLLFEKRIPARKFASTDIDAFAETVEDDLMDKYQAQITIANMENELKV